MARGLLSQRVDVAVAPVVVESGRVPDLGLHRVPEPDQHERVGQGALPTRGQSEELGDHAFASHTAAHLKWGCLLTGSQSVIVRSFPA